MSLIYTNSKSKVKPKQKSKAERDAYAEWCAKYGIDPNGKRRRREKVSVVNSPVVVTTITPRETTHYPSLNTGGGSCAPAAKKVYTGDKIVGIAAMHKSNLVPIFNDDAAKDVASMRR